MVNENTNLIAKKGLLDEYAYYLKMANVKIDAKLFLIGCLAVSLIVGIVAYFLLSTLGSVFLQPLELLLLSLIMFLVALDLTAGLPYTKGLSRIEMIERDLPDALKQLADTLKAGSTYEAGLREIAGSDYGPLSDEMQLVLRKLEEGENFENALRSLMENVHSRLVQRTVTIIIDSVRAGAGLAEILEEIADDARESYRISIERKTRTVMQSMFIVAAGSLIAPLIFGIISEIIAFLIAASASSGIADAATILNAINAKNTIVLTLEIYLFIEVLASALMLALMREGKVAKSLIYFPFLLLIAYVTFFLSKGLIGLLLGGLV